MSGNAIGVWLAGAIAALVMVGVHAGLAASNSPPEFVAGTTAAYFDCSGCQLQQDEDHCTLLKPETCGCIEDVVVISGPDCVDGECVQGDPDCEQDDPCEYRFHVVAELDGAGGCDIRICREVQNGSGPTSVVCDINGETCPGGGQEDTVDIKNPGYPSYTPLGCDKFRAYLVGCANATDTDLECEAGRMNFKCKACD